ncbi:E3 ubiquitin ligase TRIM40 isoform X2 [Manis javanica]|uniref:E3 ubiquitin ligase TRIM40 isoform X2 n=1 Tax=Manis javanica TaxID=9974 RepID=UPI00187ACD55|nr:tripartite motif-containing protein 40 isoform X2 [Manis javanica]KAI5939107.1 Tripartite motif-containing protein 40 [Manis javanica]
MECLVSPEHKSHCELAIENAISHYKFQEDCGTHRLAAELESQHQTRRQLDVLPQEWLDRLKDTPAQLSRSFDISRAIMKLNRLVSDLEGMAKELDTNMLKDASDLLSRSAPQKLEAIYPKLEERISQSLLQPSSAGWPCSSLNHLISDPPQPSHSPSSSLYSL